MRIIILLCAAVLLIQYQSCLPSTPGQAQAEYYCTACHLMPDPAHLTQDMWQHGVFPEMANYFIWEGKSKFSYANKSFYNKKAQIAMTDEEWQEILDYYISLAPAEPTQDTLSAPYQDHYEEVLISDVTPLSTITAFAFDDRSGAMHVSTIDSIYEYDLRTHYSRSTPSTGIYSQINLSADPPYLLDVGIITPNDLSRGAIRAIGAESFIHTMVLSGLKRPVYSLDADSVMYISQFGNVSGEVSKYNKATKEIETLLPLPGCYKLALTDLDGDQETELVAVCAQAREGVYSIDLQDHSYKPLIAFPPEFGLSDMVIADLDRDGSPEIIVTNGDNADYSIEPKSYHGIRIYSLSGDGEYEERFFHHIDGASQVELVWRDEVRFDIIVSSFFPLRHELAIQIFTSQDSGDTYDLDRSMARHAASGLWMLMDTADIDGDGDQDVILGSNIYAPGQIATEPISSDQGGDMLLLLNNTQ